MAVAVAGVVWWGVHALTARALCVLCVLCVCVVWWCAASLMEFSTIHARFLDRVRFEAPHCWKAGYEFLEPLVAVDKFPAQLD